MTKEEVEIEVQIGDIVTFEFDHFSRREAPTNPRVVRIRKDISWQDIVREFKGFFLFIYYFYILFPLLNFYLLLKIHNYFILFFMNYFYYFLYYI